MWLRDKYPEYMVDPNAPLSDAKFILNERLSIPPKDEVSEIVGLYNLPINREGVIYVSSRLVNALLFDTDGSELPDNYFIEEKTLSLSVEYGGGDTQVAFSVYRQRADSTFEKITESLRGEKKEGTKKFIAQFHYRRDREQRREENVKLYFRAHKKNTTQTESLVRPFIDGIVAIETERNGQRDFFEFNGISDYGGRQQWYEDPNLFLGVNEWNTVKGRRMNMSGCGPIAATNVIYYYAQQFNDSFAKLRTSSGFQDTLLKLTQKQYMHMAFSVYNRYTLQTIQGLPLGIWFIDPLCDGIIEFAQERGVHLKKHTLTNKALSLNNSFKQAVDFITEGLKNNYPVILLVTLNSYIASIERDPPPNQWPEMAQRHIVVITAMKRTKNDDEDYELIVSSWGERRIIPSLKKMWEDTPVLFDAAQVALAATAVTSTAARIKKDNTPAWVDGVQVAATFAAPLANSFASVSLGYCSFG